MRKLFFVLAVMSAGTFAFASNTVTEIPSTFIENEEIVATHFNIENIQFDDNSICVVQYTIYSAEGEALSQESMMWESSTASTREDCLSEFTALWAAIGVLVR